MTLNLNENCIRKLKESLKIALENVKTKNTIFLDYNSLIEIEKMESILPGNSKKNELIKYVSELPFFEFILSRLTSDLIYKQSYNKKREFDNLRDLPNYSNLHQVSDRLVDEFNSLPWKYTITVDIGKSFSKYITEEITEITNELRFVKKGTKLNHIFPLTEKNSEIDKNLFENGLDSLLFSNEWEENTLYLQISVSGYLSRWITTTPMLEAIDSLKTMLGFLIAMRLIGVRQQNQNNLSKLFYIVHRWENAWTSEIVIEVEENINKTITSFSPGALDEITHCENEKNLYFKDKMNLISKALSQGEDSKKLCLASKWLFDSYCGQNELLSFIQTTIVLEILLGDKSVTDIIGIGKLISNRCAYLISENQKERESVLKSFNKMYDIRSKIVHSGQSRLSKEEKELFYKLQTIAKKVIMKEMELLGNNS